MMYRTMLTIKRFYCKHPTSYSEVHILEPALYYEALVDVGASFHFHKNIHIMSISWCWFSWNNILPIYIASPTDWTLPVSAISYVQAFWTPSHLAVVQVYYSCGAFTQQNPWDIVHLYIQFCFTCCSLAYWFFYSKYVYWIVVVAYNTLIDWMWLWKELCTIRVNELLCLQNRWSKLLVVLAITLKL